MKKAIITRGSLIKVVFIAGILLTSSIFAIPKAFADDEADQAASEAARYEAAREKQLEKERLEQYEKQKAEEAAKEAERARLQAERDKAERESEAARYKEAREKQLEKERLEQYEKQKAERADNNTGLPTYAGTYVRREDGASGLILLGHVHTLDPAYYDVHANISDEEAAEMVSAVQGTS